MKKAIFFLLLLLNCSILYAQSDTTAYQLQRRKVNDLLADRSSKFGQYDESLNMRTGIFGFKTKRDMQRSLDIMGEIVQTDNNIFRELKILLDYKDLEKGNIQTKAIETEDRIGGYTETISKLQDRNEKLNTQVLETEKKLETQQYLVYALLLSSLILGYLLYRSKKLT